MIRSRLCTQDQLRTAEYAMWCRRMRDLPRLHRKQWEFCFVAESLEQLGMLAPGSRGVGFAVGQEPLPSLFASYGCEIVATDLDESQAQQTGWANSRQHMKTLAAMNSRGICEQGAFDRLVSMRHVDMNAIPDDLRDFDFTWSSCSFEHLGSIELGLEFVRNSLKCLKPGGVAVHTTEFNCTSNNDTVSEGGTVLFRRQDFERLAARLRAEGHEIELDFNMGSGPADAYVDMPPYCNAPHLKLALWQFVSTSIGLIVRKNPNGARCRPGAQELRQVYAADGVASPITAPVRHQAVVVNPEAALALVMGRFKMLVSPFDTAQGPHLLLDGYFDPPVSQAFARLIRPGMRVLDIGARYGYFTLMAADLAGPRGRVDAFEANDSHYSFLERNVALNHLESQVGLHRQTAPPETAVDFIRADADSVSAETLAGILRNNLHASVVLKFHLERLRRRGVMPRQFLSRLGSIGFAMSTIREDGTWQPVENIDSVIGSDVALDLLLYREPPQTQAAPLGWIQ